MLYTGIKRMYDAAEKKRTIKNLIKLREQLDKEVPQKTAANSLLLATWNIRQFDKNTRKQESLYYIAEIMSRFDLIAVQEVRDQKQGLEKVMSILGKNWSYISTDVTEGGPGNSECIAFVYDTNKVSFKNMAGEIVLPKELLIDDNLQFARTPFCVSFQSGWFKFNLATVHILYGKEKEQLERRRKEIETLAQFLNTRAKNEEFNYVVLGDFNIPDVGDRYMRALEDNGFHIPDDIKKHPTDLGETKHYDQIAFNLHLNDTMQIFDEKEQRSGAFNFTKSVYGENDYEEYLDVMPDKKTSVPNPDKPGKNKTVKERRTGEEAKSYFKSYYRTFQMSDHLPLWVELKVDFSGQYLEDLQNEDKNKDKAKGKKTSKKK